MKTKISGMAVPAVESAQQHGEIKLRRLPNITYKVHFEGVTPLITHRYVPEDPSAKATRTKLKPAEEAYSGLYLNDKHQCCVEAHMIYACLVEAGTHIKGVKKTRYSAKRDIAAGLSVSALDGSISIPILIDGKPAQAPSNWIVQTLLPYEIYSAGVVLTGRITRWRPRFDKWSLDFIVVLDPELLDKETLAQTADIAGRRCGLGDNRPSSPKKPGLHGKFQITSITEL